jgi:hypothetical protein
MADALMPKTVLLVSQALQAQPSVADVVERRVSYRLAKTFPCVRLTDVGTIERGPEEALQRIQVECWADDYDTAEDLSRAVVSVVGDLAGTWPAGFIAGGGVESGPFPSPDDSSERYRHQLDLGLWLYPSPS